MNVLLKKSMPLLAASLVAIGINGCAYKEYSGESSTSSYECKTISACSKLLSDNKSELSAAQAKLNAQNQKIADLKRLLEQAKANKNVKVVEKVVTKTVPAPTTSATSTLYPPNAKPGECYARVLIPAKYTTKKEKVLVREASEKLEVIPAKYKWVTKKVLVKEASTKLVTIPPVYETVTEKLLVKPASEKIVTIPAVYETVTEKVLVKPAQTVWKKGRGPIEKVDGSTGEIMCLVEVPAVYKTITKRVLKTPARTKTIPVPAVYKKVTKRVVKTPARTKTIPVPAVYKTVRVKELVTPATVRKVPIPAKYQTITKRVKVSDATLKWTPILCKTNFSVDLIKKLQRALAKRGFNPGPIDGVYGWRTKAAVNKFQKANSLSTGALTIETLNALGVK